MESPMPVWLRRCATLAAWLSVATGARALSTFLPIDVPSPCVGNVWGAAVAVSGL